MTAMLALWALIQTLTVIGVANFLRHVPRERLTEGPGGVVVIAAIRGPWPNADAFIESLLNQECVNPRLILAISGPDDPAWPASVAWRDRSPDRIEIVAAGISAREGQKIHKLRAAVAALRADDRYLVFVDTDFVPPARLIGRLLFPVVRGKAPIGTGYRLLLPAPSSPILSLVAAIDLQVATLPRPPQGTVAWGGATAMARETFEALNVAREWHGRLSDDLTVTRLARAARVGVRPVRDLMLGTPFHGTARDAFAFAVRQYRHLFWNMPAIWLAAAAIALVQTAGWLWAIGWGGWPALAIAYAAAWTRAGLRAAVIAKVLPEHERRKMRAALAWDCLLPFAVTLTHAACIAAAPFSRRIRWGALDYRMARGGKVMRVDPITPPARDGG